MAGARALPRALAAAAVACLLGPRGAGAANASEPHPRRGVIPRLKIGGKPKVSLTSKDLEHIEQGHIWMHSEEVGGIGRGLAIRDIAAPWEVVFGQVTDLKGYVGKVPLLSELQVYSSTASRSEVVEHAAYKIKVIPGYRFEYFVEHHAVKSKRTFLFFLDYGRNSDFQDMQGRWFLEEHPTKPGWTRAYYQVELMLWGFAPKIVKTILTSQGLSSAIGWVKQHSETGTPSLVASSALVPAGAAGAAAAGACATWPLGAALSVASAAALAVARRRSRRRRREVGSPASARARLKAAAAS